jgi:hypothetical protein
VTYSIKRFLVDESKVVGEENGRNMLFAPEMENRSMKDYRGCVSFLDNDEMNDPRF